MDNIFILFILFHIFLSYKRTVYGCCCLLISRILIPEFVRLSSLPFNLNISLNTAIIGILTLFCFRDIISGKCKVRYIKKDQYVKVLFLFMLFWLISLPLSDFVDFKYQISRLIQFTITDIIPAICFIIAIRDLKDISLAFKTLFICSAISCLWGIASLVIGSNIYVNVLSILYQDTGLDIVATEALSESRGFAATTGTFSSYIGWGIFLPLTFVLAYYMYKELHNKFIIIVAFLLSIGVFICSKRAAIVSYLTFWIFSFFFSKSKAKIKFVYYAILGLVLLLVAINFVPQLEKMKGLVESSIFFWNDEISEQNDISGSSWSMRVGQVTYCFTEVSNNILFGNGFGWTWHYIELVRPYHPILYGFENIISAAVCNGGIFGLAAWIYLFVKSYKYSLGGSKSANHILYTRLFTIVQLTSAMATGLSCIIFYVIFTVMLNKYIQFKKQ